MLSGDDRKALGQLRVNAKRMLSRCRFSASWDVSQPKPQGRITRSLSQPLLAWAGFWRSSQDPPLWRGRPGSTDQGQLRSPPHWCSAKQMESGPFSLKATSAPHALLVSCLSGYNTMQYPHKADLTSSHVLLVFLPDTT